MAEFFDEEDQERAELYRLFAAVFLEEPDEEFLVNLKEVFGMEFEEPEHEIRADFRRLFNGTAPLLRPYESLFNYHFGEQPRTSGTTAHTVREHYKAAGLLIDEDAGLAPDHLSVELLFISYLIEHGRIEEQKNFLSEHLLQWVPAFTADLEKQAGTTFFREISGLLRELITSDGEKLEAGEHS